MDRIIDVASEHIDRLNKPLSSSSKTDLLRSVLAGIQYCRCTTEYELLALFLALMPSLESHTSSIQSQKKRAWHEDDDKKRFITSMLPPRASLILIDTISNLMRFSIPDESRQLRNQRSQLIDELRCFAERCQRKGIKLVISNQMGLTFVGRDGNTTTLSDKDGEGRLAPLLRNQGDSILGQHVWRLLLFRAGTQSVGACNRFAHFISRPPETTTSNSDRSKVQEPWLPFIVNRGGVRSNPD